VKLDADEIWSHLWKVAVGLAALDLVLALVSWIAGLHLSAAVNAVTGLVLTAVAAWLFRVSQDRSGTARSMSTSPDEHPDGVPNPEPDESSDGPVGMDPDPQEQSTPNPEPGEEGNKPRPNNTR
jgi:hypothetical protein